jgi:dTDP-4-amino-4,6-dideoxygalactose transaminase
MSCASGTDALRLVLMAQGVGPGDAAFVPAFTFAASTEAVALVGATPVFVDVVPTSFKLSPASLGEAIAVTELEGRLAPRAVIPVDLFGLPADYRTILPIARARGLFVLQDAAQSFGARWCDEPAGGQGDAAATSFYPTKPLGAYGDGGAVLTSDDRLADEVRSLRLHGQRLEGAGCEHRRVGLNSGLDSLQAAIPLAKLAVLDEEIERRAALAARYDEALSDCVEVPRPGPEARSAWAQYTAPRRRARSAGGRPARAGHPQRRLLSDAPEPPAGLSALPERARRSAGGRGACQDGAQPADSPRSGGGRPDPADRCDPPPDWQKRA